MKKQPDLDDKKKPETKRSPKVMLAFFEALPKEEDEKDQSLLKFPASMIESSSWVFHLRKEFNMIAHCSDRKILKFLEKLPLPYTDHGIIIAGGCFKDILTDQIPRDVDLYFKKKENLDYYKRNFIPATAEEHENDITFVSKDGIKIDVIKCQFGSPGEIISRFDFTNSFTIYSSIF